MSRSITPQQLAELSSSGQGVELIDVRTPVEFQELHVDFARNVPLDRLDPRAIKSERNGASNEPLYVICRSGSRGQQACEKLAAVGLNGATARGTRRRPSAWPT